MEISRLTFSNETKKDFNRKKSNMELRKLRWEKLEELDRAGRLKQPMTRLDLLEEMGYPRTYGAPYTWLSKIIVDGYLGETLVHTKDSGEKVSNFYIAKTIDIQGACSRRARKAARTRKKNLAKKAIETNAVATPVAERPVGKARAVIRCKDYVIELENLTDSMVESIVSNISKK